MSNIHRASYEWATRKDDERYTSLITMRDEALDQKQRSHTAEIMLQPTLSEGALGSITVPHTGLLTDLSMSNACGFVGAPASYLKTLRPHIAAECINEGIVLGGEPINTTAFVVGDPYGSRGRIRSFNSKTYSRVFDGDILSMLVARFGNGTEGDFRVPGEFGKAVQVSKANTTLYRGERDMFIFLADEERRIDVKNRRPGESGSLARGFFVSNSEVGCRSLTLSYFLFDYVCCNRIIWGAEEFKEIRLRHFGSNPARWWLEALPVLTKFANQSTHHVSDLISKAQNWMIPLGDSPDEAVDMWIGKRLKSFEIARRARVAFEADEARPLRTLFDAVTGISALARGIANQDTRVELEKEAGALLQLAA